MHFTFCDYLFVSLDSTRNSQSYLYSPLRQTESRATATQPCSCTTSSSHSFAALQADDQQLTSENTEACQKVLAQSPALHVCLRRRCARRSTYPANCQQDNRAERITSAASNNSREEASCRYTSTEWPTDCPSGCLSEFSAASARCNIVTRQTLMQALIVHSHGEHCVHTTIYSTQTSARKRANNHVGQCLINVSELASYQATRVTIQK